MMNIDSLKKNVYMGVSAGNMGDQVLVIKEFGLVAATKIEDSIVYWLREGVLCQMFYSVSLKTSKSVSNGY